MVTGFCNLSLFYKDFLEFLLKRRPLNNLQKTANKFVKVDKKLNIMMKKEIIDSNIDLLTNFY